MAGPISPSDTGRGEAIRAVDVRKAYGPVEALRGVSLTLHEGEVLAVLGPNGAGKTTLVEILEGYRDRDAGDVKVLGRDPRSGSRVLREQVGLVLQEAAVQPYLTVREVMEMFAGYYPAPRDVNETVELVGLGEKRDVRVKKLSGGQQRRLDLGLALIGDPRLIFLDEPTTGFDPSARRTAWQLIRDMRALGKTVLLTTHYMDEAQNLADRICVIAAGRVVAEGTPDTIGGRNQAAVHIRFAAPGGRPPSDLPLPATSDGDGAVVIETRDVVQALHTLTGWAIERGVDLPDLSVTRPSLEDVYLELTAT
jgi:ABC-2 type transport system ATP-binding protein